MSNALHKTQNSFRKRLVLALAPVVAIASLSAPAFAQGQNAEAERLNSVGKEHFKERRYLDAYKNFKQATAASPEGRYFFNLCFSLNYLERFQEAIEACEQVEPNGADAKLRDKTNAVLKALRAQVPAQPANPNTNPTGPNTNPTGPNTNPTNPNTNPTNPNTNPTGPNTNPAGPPPRGPVQVPGLDPFAEKAAVSNDYQWSIGAGVAPVANLGIGKLSTDMGDVDLYAASGVKLNVMANFLFRPDIQVGAQGYLSVTNLPAVEPQFYSALTIIDVGAAIYKHIPLTEQIQLTALAGIHFTAQKADPNTDEFFLGLGARASVSADYAFGPSKEHVVSLSPALNIYGGVADAELIASEFGLDKPSAALEFGFSYQYRFTSAFGQSGIFSLE